MIKSWDTLPPPAVSCRRLERMVAAYLGVKDSRPKEATFDDVKSLVAMHGANNG